MTVPGNLSSPLLATAAAAGAGAAAVGPTRSVRFDDASNTGLFKTPSSSGNRKTWTFSCWFKKSSSYSDGGYQTIFGVGESSSTTIMEIGFDSIDKLRLGDFTSGGATVEVDGRVSRDYSAWTHLVVKYDTTQATATDRVEIYFNGVDVTNKSATFPAQNRDSSFNHTLVHVIGARESNLVNRFDGYLADIYMIDGTALDPTSFGEFDSNGVWQAINYDGSYGTNGFHLAFDNVSTVQDFGEDTSGNNNDYSVNGFSYVAGATTHYSTMLTFSSGSFDSSYPPFLAFDGNGGTGTRSASTGVTLTFTPTSAISYSSSVKIETGHDCDVSLNGGASVFSDGGEKTLATGSGTVTSIAITPNPSSQVVRLERIKIDDVILLDPRGEKDSDLYFDVPVNGSQSDTGAGGEVSGNYATLNPLDSQSSLTLSNGNLDVSNTANSLRNSRATISYPATGKWYYEYTPGGSANMAIGIADSSTSLSAENSGTFVTYHQDGAKNVNGTKTASAFASYTSGDVIGVMYDSGSNSVTFYKNNSSQGSVTPTSGKTYFPFIITYNTTGSFNFGARAFAYTAPSSAKALCTTNLPTPTIADGSDYFDIKLWTGNGTSQGVGGLAFSPDMVWLKSRSNAYGHRLLDTVRGATKRLQPEENNAESTEAGGLTSFNSDGFSLGNDSRYNASSETYVGWAWDAGSTTASNTDGSVTSNVRANQTAGFSIVTFTNPSSGAFTVGHGLNAQVGLVIMKHTNRSGDWLTWVSGFSNSEYLNLSDNAAKASASEVWGSSAPGSSTFGGKIGVSALAGDTDVAYCFAPVAGYSAFGSYTGNGNADGPFIHTGFKVAFLITKRTDSSTSGNWNIVDTTRGTHNPVGPYLYADNANIEGDVTIYDLLSNGFKIRESGAGTNANGSSYIYLAFAENPFFSNGGLAR